MKVDIVTSIKGKLLAQNAKICNFEKNLIKGSKTAITKDWIVITSRGKQL